MPSSDEDRARIAEAQAPRQPPPRDTDPPAKGFWRALAAPENVRWIVVSLMIPLATGIWSYFDSKQHEAERRQQADLAEARKDVDQVTALIPSLVSDKPAERVIGISVLSSLATARKAGPGITAAYRQIQLVVGAGQDSTNPVERKEAAINAESILQGSSGAASGGGALSSTATDASATTTRTAVALTAPAMADAKPRYVYIQLFRDADRAAAQQLQDSLRQAGVPVPGIENVVSTQGARMLATGQLRTIDVRYFREADRDAALRVASDIGKLLPAFGAPTVKAVSGLARQVRPGLVEVWFPCADTRDACRALGT